MTTWFDELGHQLYDIPGRVVAFIQSKRLKVINISGSSVSAVKLGVGVKLYFQCMRVTDNGDMVRLSLLPDDHAPSICVFNGPLTDDPFFFDKLVEEAHKLYYGVVRSGIC